MGVYACRIQSCRTFARSGNSRRFTGVHHIKKDLDNLLPVRLRAQLKSWKGQPRPLIGSRRLNTGIKCGSALPEHLSRSVGSALLLGYQSFDLGLGFPSGAVHGLQCSPSRIGGALRCVRTIFRGFQGVSHYRCLVGINGNSSEANENEQKIKQKLSVFVFGLLFLLFSLACFKIGNATVEKEGRAFVAAFTEAVVLFFFAQSAYCILRAVRG